MENINTRWNVTRVIALVIIGSFFLTMISMPSNAQATKAGWESSGTILNTGPGSVNSPSIAMDNNGDSIAVWVQHDGANDSIYADHYAAGAWETAIAIETGTGAASSPHVAMDRNGNGVAVWQQYDGTYDSIYANRYTAGAWGTAKLIENDSGEAGWSEVAMSSNGDAMAVWLQNVSGSYFSVYAARFSGGSGEWPHYWTMEPVMLSNHKLPSTVVAMQWRYGCRLPEMILFSESSMASTTIGSHQPPGARQS